MKDRLRETIFNLLGPDIRGMHALDLFAGTGAIGLEALSRGAAKATFIERHFPTAKVIEKNIATLGVEAVCEVVASDTFFWDRQETDLGAEPWVIFCSPPYDFYVERPRDMLKLIERLIARAPKGSIVVVESDGRFDPETLPQADAWLQRSYPPALLGVLRM